MHFVFFSPQCLNHNRIYALLGNAVPPPIIACVAGCLLESLGVLTRDDWTRVAIALATDVLMPPN